MVHDINIGKVREALEEALVEYRHEALQIEKEETVLREEILQMPQPESSEMENTTHI